MPNEKPFSQSGLVFFRFVPFIILKTTILIPWIQCKNKFAKIFAKVFLNMVNQTKPNPNHAFSQISQHRMGRFSYQFLGYCFFCFVPLCYYCFFPKLSPVSISGSTNPPNQPSTHQTCKLDGIYLVLNVESVARLESFRAQRPTLLEIFLGP